MKVIILAAGYATRLHPLTLNQPKPLLPIAGKPMLDHVMRVLSPIKEIEEMIIVTNSKFYPHFQEWAANTHFLFGRKRPTVVDDFTSTDANKRGAIGDIHYVIRQRNIHEDLMILAGDNLFEQDLGRFAVFCLKRNTSVVGIYDVGNLEIVKKYSCVTTDAGGRITHFEEKPTTPGSTLCAIALYYYPSVILPLIEKYIAQGNNPDQPGRLVSWLYPRVPVYTWRVPGLWYDIGSLEGLQEADQIFKNLKQSRCMD